MKTNQELPLALELVISEAMSKDENQLKVLSGILTVLFNKAKQADYRALLGMDEDWHAHNKISDQYSLGCGCLYCRTMHEYIKMKIEAHRATKRLDYLWGINPKQDMIEEDYLKHVTAKWALLREESHKIKKDAGL